MASVPGVLDFIVPYILFNVQSATLAHPLWTSAYLNSASTSNPPCLLIPFGLPYAFPLLQCPICRSCSSLLDFSIPSLRFNVQSAVLAPSIDFPWSIGKRERRSSRFLTPFFLWTRGESNPCPKTHSLFFYYHS